MIHLAVHYNNLDVDILSSGHKERRHCPPNTGTRNVKTCYVNDCDHFSGESCAKRRKLLVHKRSDERAQNEASRTVETEHRVNEALAYFQKALSLIVQTTEHHHYFDKGLRYHPNDEDGFLRYENEAMGRQLVGSINPQKHRNPPQGRRRLRQRFYLLEGHENRWGRRARQ
jgi:outer membrane receptor for Fe3+-dicitrate